MSSTSFRREVWAFYKKHGRHDLPWRKTTDPYKILVSEIMLQQTQVDRVVPFYRDFIKRFPTAKRLARATLAEALRSWQGLGYNRRAKMLHQAAKAIAAESMPRDAAGLQILPGVGPYTARAVAAFAYNQDGVMVETNIRTAIIHHFFPKRTNVTDKEIAKVLVQTLPEGKAREWYWALMDYGAYLKRTGVSHNTRSRHYTKQSRFSGSLREVRGAIIRELLYGPASMVKLNALFGIDRRAHVATARDLLVQEGLIERRGRMYHLAS